MAINLYMLNWSMTLNLILIHSAYGSIFSAKKFTIWHALASTSTDHDARIVYTVPITCITMHNSCSSGVKILNIRLHMHARIIYTSSHAG